MLAYDPKMALSYQSNDSILSMHHKEWQELVYVFLLAKDLITTSSAPIQLRCKYAEKIKLLQSRVGSYIPRMTDKIVLHSHDPASIKAVKQQANILLQKEAIKCPAWRMDMATLFERYVQHILASCMQQSAGQVITNKRIRGSGRIPQWGVHHLEPDAMMILNGKVVMADAKYKANSYAESVQSEVLRETHRADLHQILAYCAFEPQDRKTGILFYPANEIEVRPTEYKERIFNTSVRIIRCGVPFTSKGLNTITSELNQRLVKDLLFE